MIAEGIQGVSVLTIINGLFLELFFLQLVKPRLDIGCDAKNNNNNNCHNSSNGSEISHLSRLSSDASYELPVPSNIGSSIYSHLPIRKIC